MTPVRSWTGSDLAASPAGGPPEALRGQGPARAGVGEDVAPGWAAGSGQPGRIVAVWGPKGAPGRTTIALNLAFEAAPLVGEALLVDADTYGGSVAQSLGFVEDYPGLAWAARLANRGDLDVPKLWQAARRAAPEGPRVLTGLPRAELWTEIRPATWEHLLGQFREAFPLTVLDVGFCLEEDEELLYDQVRFRRNAVARIAVEQADLVVAVARADPVGLHDFIRGWQAFQELGVGADRVRLVVNQLRSGLFGGDTDEQIRAALTRYLGMAPVAFVPYDRAAMDASLLAARALAEARPASPARAAIAELARTLLGVPAEPVGAARARRPFLTGLLGRGGPSGPPPYADLGNGLPAGPAAEPGRPGFGPGGAWMGA
jgi:MinD-like ATPase involved in chromosome partitioning or flagellar assembly